jgi:hypothetical protein
VVLPACRDLLERQDHVLRLYHEGKNVVGEAYARSCDEAPGRGLDPQRAEGDRLLPRDAERLGHQHAKLRAPTLDETLRVKGYLLVLRNQTRDYLDVAALADRSGVAHAAEVLGHIDDYYADQRPRGVAGVATQLARQLADPQPADRASVGQLSRYKGLERWWTDWDAVVEVCRAVATGMVTQA